MVNTVKRNGIRSVSHSQTQVLSSRLKSPGIGLIAILFVLCFVDPVIAQEEPPTEWSTVRDQRRAAIASYLAENEIAYRWFADFPFGTDDGIPYLILRSLPLLAPEHWGPEEEFLGPVGLFRDQRQPEYPLPRGIGWSGLGRSPEDVRPDFASFACGACHVGRLREDNGAIVYLDGGINSQFNVVGYRMRVKKTVDGICDPTASLEERVKSAKQSILKVIDQMHQKSPNYFYGNYSLGQHFNAEYEAKQVELFKEHADDLIRGFLIRADLEVGSLVELIKKNYHGFEQPMSRGFGGMADATGVSTSFGFVFARDIEGDTAATPETRLPPTPGLTDFMAVWEQGKRKSRWNQDQTDLVDGGGQWNGNIPLPIYRNLAAELTMGFGAKTDVRISAFAERLLENLPAPPYPFEVDMQLAKKGEQLFDTNCRDCHRPHNGRVYSNLGTDMGRAGVVSEQTALGARVGFTQIGSPQREVVLPPNGEKLKPFATFEGVSLENHPKVIMRDPKDCFGYNALPLGGIWAQAPYLHTGSVPTLYHLLMPDERPAVFWKSRLEYDRTKVGFAWTPAVNSGDSSGYRFDTRAFPSLTRRGHDRDVYDSGKRYKLDWSEDPAGAMALIEYLKTL